MREISYTSRFLKDYRQIKKRGWDLQKLEACIEALAIDHPLPGNARPHRLSGKFADTWDAHVGSDWILIYEIRERYLILRRTGTHADLFR